MLRKTRREEKLECSARNRLKDIATCSLITIELGESKDENLGFTVGIVTITNSVASGSRKRSRTFAILSLSCSTLSDYEFKQRKLSI